MPKLAANLSMLFTEWEFVDRFAAAADAGFEAVEFLFPYAYSPEMIAERLRRHGLAQVLFNLPPGDWQAGERGLACHPERRAEFEASVEIALRYAGAIGATRLHLMSGHGARDDRKAADAYRAAIEFACARAAGQGIDILIEPINGRDMPGYFLNDFNEAARLVAEIGCTNLKLQYDIYHRQILHGDVMRSLEELLPLIGHVQLASVPGRNEPGSGELDDGRILRHLDAIGYRGFVGLEYRPAGGTQEGLAWRDKLGFS